MQVQVQMQEGEVLRHLLPAVLHRLPGSGPGSGQVTTPIPPGRSPAGLGPDARTVGSGSSKVPLPIVFLVSGDWRVEPCVHDSKITRPIRLDFSVSTWGWA